MFINFKDILTRFGYHYLKKYLNEFGVNIIYLNELQNQNIESEMVEDMIAIIHSFNGKLYGLRSHRQINKKTHKDI